MSQAGYFVCYTAGTSGAFVASLVAQIVNNTQREFGYTMNGNSHSNMLDANGGLDWGRAPSPITSEYFYNNIFTFDSRLPMVMQSHIMPAWDIVNSRWPGFKAVIVTHTIKDLEEIAANLYYKYYLDDFEVSAKNAFMDIILQNQTIFGRIVQHPSELTEDEIKVFMKILVYHKLTDGYVYPKVPDEYKENALLLPYWNIVNDQEATLKALSEFLGRPVPQITYDNYTAYLEHQHALINEKAGWLKAYNF